MTNLRTIDKEKLEKEIDVRSAIIDDLTRGKAKTDDIALAIKHAPLLAEHNALVAIFNSLK